MANYESIASLLEAGTDNMEVIRNNSANDDGTDSITGVDWFTFNSKVVSTVYVSGNTYFGFGENSEHLKVNRQDAKVYYIWREEGEVHGHKFLKIRWKGYSPYNQTSSSYLLEYDVIMFDDMSILLHMVNIPTSANNGTYSLTNSAGTITYTVTTENPNVTFIYATSTNSYSAVNAIQEFYDKKYLIESAGVYYNIVEGALNVLPISSLSASAFEQYGLDEIPSGELLVSLVSPSILYWQDSSDPVPSLVANVTASPIPQIIISEEIFIVHPSIKGIANATCEYTGNPLIAISFDNKISWKYIKDTNWITATENFEGMSPNELIKITTDQWKSQIEGSTSLFIKVILSSLEDSITKIVIQFNN
nr:MAG TPA: hypothetical protein [Caudoviricetes sp.]